MRRSPAFSALVIATLALGIGANTALFSIIDRVLLHPFPYRDAQSLVDITGRSADGKPRNITPAQFDFYLGRIPAFQQAAIWKWRDLMLTGVNDPESLWALEVSPQTFDILGVPPLHGRLFRADDFRSESAPVVIVGYRFWQRHFHGDLSVLGHQILLDRQGYSVVGIMGPDFSFHRPGFEVWVPLNPFRVVKEEVSVPSSAMARLRPGATIQQAQHDMDAITPSLPPDPGEPGWRPILRPFADQYVGEYRTALYVLWGAVLFVILIACANAANLILARASNRRREFAIRASLGAGSTRLAMQMVRENMMLGVMAGLVGLALAAALLRILPASIPLLRPDGQTVTPSALLVTLGVVLATTFLCALPACWHVWRSDLSAALHSASRSTTADRGSNRTRSALVVCEVALSVTLLVGAGVMLHSLSRLMSVPLGFNADHVLTARVSAPSQIKATGPYVDYFNRVLDEVAAIPGTRSSAIVTVLPLSNLVLTTSFDAEGHVDEWRTYPVRLRSVSPAYFQTMGVRLLRGRAFHDRDTEKSPSVAIVNDVLARHYWPGQDPIGKRVSRDSKNQMTVVGVIESARDTLRESPGAELYRPYTQDITAARATSVVVLTNGDPLSIAPLLQKRIHALNHDQPVTEVKTMNEWVSEAVAKPRFDTILLEIFAGLAFLLAIGGVFAVVSFAVTQRTNEIGIRSALGATTRDIASFVLSIGLRPVLAGSLAGVIGAVAATRALRSQLFETAPLDPAVFVVVLPLLLCSALAACLIPARRATRIDPAITLRAE